MESNYRDGPTGNNNNKCICRFPENKKMAQCELYHKECEQIPEGAFKRIKASIICILSLYLKSYYCAILTTIITINIPQITQQPLCIRFPVYRMLRNQEIPKMPNAFHRMHKFLESVEYIQYKSGLHKQ